MLAGQGRAMAQGATGQGPSGEEERPGNVSSLPPHLVAEAMQAMRGGSLAQHLDQRWSAPFTQDEMRYVEDYVRSKYPEIYMERVVGMNLPSVEEEEGGPDGSPGDSPSVRDHLERQRQPDSGRRKPSIRGFMQSGLPREREHWKNRWAPAGGTVAEEPGRAELNPSRLAEIMSDNTVSTDNSLSVTHIRTYNRVLQRCGVLPAEYHVVFTESAEEALLLVAEAYPFHRHNVYLTALKEEADTISHFAVYKEAKVIQAPPVWLDLRIEGSQLSTTFRKKSKSNPKGLFAYPLQAGALKSSLHWVSEAQRNLWHVLLDASEVVLDADTFDLGEHKPDYVVCVSPKIPQYPKRVTCLLIRRASQSPGPR